ncbi:TPA: phage tail protein, partial [Salmonella enterica subsp. salamae serovar 28:r:e,n,z15]|nr:phage tail protein [Salmonella enterica subsp. salamae serovar 28:r:e,n,z15]
AVVNGKVVIDEAVIREATIKILMAQHIVADEVKAGISITTPVLRSATIQNGNFQVDSTGNLRIGGLFSISNSGQITIRNSYTNVGLVIRNDRIDVYDGNGRLAVRVGKLN